MAESAPLLRVYRVTSIEGSNPSLSAMLLKMVLAAMLASILTACDGEKPQEIEWQLPMSVPNDPHASDKGTELPEWAKSTDGRAELVFLEKSTTRTFTVEIENGSEQTLNEWGIKLQGLATGLRIKDQSFINDETTANPAGFVILTLEGRQVYKGWLYQNFPELFGLDNANWKVWMKGISVPSSSQEE